MTGKTPGRMQYTYKTKKDAEDARKYWASRAGSTIIRRNKRKGPDTYTLIIQF